jgi:uncharacterized protein YggT (Ycf19 family)
VWAHVAGFVIGAIVGLLLPRGVSRGRQGPLVRRAGGPGPARLVTSIAELAGLFVVVRIGLHFLAIRAGSGALGGIAALAYGVTEPFVRPFVVLIPSIAVFGRPIDLPAIVLLLVIYALAGWLASLLSRSESNRAIG